MFLSFSSVRFRVSYIEDLDPFGVEFVQVMDMDLFGFYMQTSCLASLLGEGTDLSPVHIFGLTTFYYRATTAGL